MQIDIKTDRLIMLRQNLGLTQAEAAEMIGVSQPAYHRYEAGVRTPSIQVAREIAKAFNVSVDYLTGKSNRKTPDLITIDRKEDPALFSIVDKCRRYDDVQLKKIVAYLDSIK